MSKVLVAIHEFVRRAMAGPGIRAYELRRQLHRAGQAVTLAVPGQHRTCPPTFRDSHLRARTAEPSLTRRTGHDVVIASRGVLPHSKASQQAATGPRGSRPLG